MKDIFIDANIANKFATPPSDDYKKLIKWLLSNDRANPENNAILMLSDKLIGEYKGGGLNCCKTTSIGIIVNAVLVDNRYKKISTLELKTFITRHITKKIKKDIITCNSKDWWHFPLVFYSSRKIAVVEDKKFLNDLINFPRFSKGVKAFTSPEDAIYS